MSQLLKQGRSGAKGTIELSPEGFAQVFPFHFACDDRLTLTQAGASLARMAPDLRPGVPMAEALCFSRPSGEPTPELLGKHQGSLVVLQHRASGILLRGQFLATEGVPGWVFLGSPWLVSGEALEASGLSLEDFPPHDAVAELLLFGQTQQMAINDLKLLNERLERKREQVARTEALYRDAISAATAVPYQEDFASDRFSYVGEGFAKLTGYPADELAPSHLRELEKPADSGPDTTESTSLSTEVATLRRRSEYPFRTRDGKLRWLSDASVVIQDATGTPVGAIGMLQDVTARRNAQERLRRSEAEARRLAIVTSRTSSLVILTNAERGIEWVNEAFATLTGFTLEDVRGRSMRDVLDSDQADPEATERFDAAMSRREPLRSEIRLRRKDGSHLWLAAEVQPLLDADGALTGFTAVGTDITAAKTYEQRLEELAAELRAVCQVAARVRRCARESTDGLRAAGWFRRGADQKKR